MRLLSLPICAALAGLMTTSCAGSPPPVIEPPLPLPAEFSTRCPPPPAPASPLADDVALTLKAMYDLYGPCAGRLVNLLDWIGTRGKP